jgi:hypothetical protein
MEELLENIWSENDIPPGSTVNKINVIIHTFYPEFSIHVVTIPRQKKMSMTD